MDAFYASIEQRDHPEYRGRPVVVGGLPDGRRGVVATASYEARVFGIHSAMSSKKAFQLCPKAVFLRPRFEVYKEVSRKMHEIFTRYTDLIEPLSQDEAYLDVTEDKLNIGSAIEIARQIRQAIKNELQLTASAGVSVNKFMAKIASEIRKPDGLTFIGPSKIHSFMEKLPVEKFHGVGKVTAEKMKNMGLHTGADIKKLSEAELIRHFGKAGRFYYNIVRGIDEREVEPNRETKSAGAEDTFAYDLTNIEEMYLELDKIAQIVHNRLIRHNLRGRTITLKIKYSDFRQITRNHSFAHPVDDLSIIRETARQLLAATEPEGDAVRLLGITLSNFGDLVPAARRQDHSGQLRLFP